MSRRQYLLFKLNGDQYAIPLSESREIVQYVTPVKLPSVPDTVAGVMNLRGKMVAVINLAKRLGLPKSLITPRTCIIIAETPTEPMGFIVDEIEEVIELDDDNIELCPTTMSQDCSDVLTGIIEREGRAIVCLSARSKRIVA